MVRFWLLKIILLFPFALSAAPMSFVYQGQIIKPDAQPLEAANVDFTIQVLSPAPNLCVLFEETHSSINMASSNGLFSLPVGGGTPGAGHYANLADAFDNSRGSEAPATCDVPAAYDANPGDTRVLRVTFNEGGGPVTIADSTIRSVPFAKYASSLEGFSAADFVQINTNAPSVVSQTNLEWVFETTRYAELQALINGTSTQYMVSSPSSAVDFNGQVIDNIATPVDANDAASKGYVDTRIGGQNADTLVTSPTIAQDGYVLSWNNTTSEYELLDGSAAFGDNLGNHTATANIQTGANFISNDGTASQGLSFDGTNNANFSQNLTVSQGFSVTNGIASGGNISLTTESELRLEDNAGGEYMGLKAPATVTTNVTLTLPDGDGGANQVLGTDGSGQLQWQTDQNTDAVDSVHGRTGAVVSANGDYTASEVTNVAAGNIAAITVQTAIDELDSEKLALAGGTMTGNLVMNTAARIQLTESAGTGELITIVPPADATAAYSLQLPVDDGAANEVLQTDGSGVLTWVAQTAAAPVTTVHGRAGVVVSANGDYTASEVTNVAAGDVAAITVQAAIDELDSEKLALAGGTMTGNLVMNTAARIQLTESAGTGELITIVPPADATAAYSLQLPVDDGAANEVLQTDGSGVLTWVAQTAAAPVTTVHGRAGVVVSANGDYTASEVTNVAAGDVAAITVQAAIDELDSEKLALAGGTMTGNLVMNTAARIQLTESAGTGELITIVPPADATAAYSLQLPVDDGAANEVLQTDGSGVLSWAAASTGDFLATGTVPMTGNLRLNDNWLSNDGDNEGIRIDNNGNVGIGSSSPGFPLDIYRASGGADIGVMVESVSSNSLVILKSNTSNKNPGVALFDQSTDTRYGRLTLIRSSGSAVTGGARNDTVLLTENSQDLLFAPNQTVAMTLKTGGNVGVGTNSPGTRLDVEGAITAGPTGTAAGQTGQLILEDLAAGGVFSATIKSPDTLGASYALTLPVDDGTANQVLQTDGSGALTWVNQDGVGASDINGLSDAITDYATNDAMFLGQGAGANNTGYGNMGFGESALNAAVGGVSQSIAIGIETMKDITSGANNIAVGHWSQGSAVGAAANDNISIGNNSLFYNKSGDSNVAIGASSASGGASATAISQNVLVGYRTAYSATDASNNVMIGYSTGSNVTTGDDNVLIGHDIDLPASTTSNYLNIGNVIRSSNLGATNGDVHFEDEIHLDNDANTFSAAIRAPAALGANYVLTLPVDDGTANQVLETNGSGVLSWVTPTTVITDHGGMGGLGDDDHTQYTLLAGRSGGQSLIGGTASGDDLTFESTSHATKGDIVLQPNGGNVGIGPGTPNHLVTGYYTDATVYTSTGAARSPVQDNTGFVMHNLSNTTNSGAFLSLESENVNGVAGNAYVGGISEAGNYDISLVFGRSTGVSSYVESMRIDDNGNVGIATTGPSEKLDVNGNIRSRGQIFSDQNVIASGATVDFDNGNVQVLQSVGGSAITLNNMEDGASYTLIVTDATSRTYTFTNCTNTHFSPANAATTASTHTTYTFLKVTVAAATHCYISWITGFTP